MANRRHAGRGPAATDVPEPSLAERARTLALTGRIGVLSTQSLKLPGYPFGSLMPYAADHLGRPIFFISSMAMHTQNIGADPRASLFIAQAADDPLSASRLTLLGTAVTAPPEQVRDLYFSRYENARYWQDFSDFTWYRLEVAGVYFIGGFGVMGWVAAEEYVGAAPDPLAETAPEILAHMNAEHAEALKHIARRFAGEEADEAEMTTIDRLGFHLKLKTADRLHGCRVAFPAEVRNQAETREMLLEMARSAEAA